MRWRLLAVWGGILALLLLVPVGDALAHGVEEGDKAFLRSNPGVNIIAYIYLGAKHMVTGYDHLLFLVGVIFFLYRARDVWLYVTLFALGHTVTLLAGVYFSFQVNPFLIDAIIGLSVVYKALDNIGAYPLLFGVQPNQKAAVLIFGLFHGLGLATKLQDLAVSRDGLLANLVSFNVGVELGQVIALTIILIVMAFWRQTPSFHRSALFANSVLMCAGIVLIGYQLTGIFLERST